MHTLCNLDLDLATGDSARLSVQARHPECGLDSRSIGRGGKLHGQKKERQNAVFLDELGELEALPSAVLLSEECQLHMIEERLTETG
jgi:hypothetical protein